MHITHLKTYSRCKPDIPLNYLHTVDTFLKSQQDLSPENEAVTSHLRELVRNITLWESENILSLQDIQHNASYLLSSLPKLCAHAECEMEKWWCRQILSGQKNLTDFWYFENYKNLVTAEAHLLGNKSYDHVIFLGSGALPLTAILLHQAYPECHISCVDHDQAACDLAKGLIDQQDLKSHIQIIARDARDFCPNPDALVICASLLQTKSIYTKLYHDNIHDLIIRDSEGLYQLLYAPAHKPHSQLYSETAKTDLSGLRINTSCYFKRTSETPVGS